MLIVFACLLLAVSVLVLGVSVRISRRTTARGDPIRRQLRLRSGAGCAGARP